MRDPLDPIEKLSLSGAIKVRVLPEFRERVVSVATAEGVSLAEFTRRAIVERVRRIEGAETPSLNTIAAQVAGNPMSGASASTTASTKRRDA